MPKNFIIGRHPGPIPGQEIPQLPKYLFWDVRYAAMDWQWSSEYVIERVLDYGTDTHVDELIRYYGRRKVLAILKKKANPIFLMDHSIQRACTYFKLKPEELPCYTKKLSSPGHWF